MAPMTAEATVELDLVLEAAYEAAEKGEVLVEISWFYQLISAYSRGDQRLS